MKKAIHYINQFFGGIGGEDKADFQPVLKEGVVGPGMAFNTAMKNVQITHTIICGDNYMGSNKDDAVKEIMELIKDIDFDFFIAGPAFQAGRYGVACIFSHFFWIRYSYGIARAARITSFAKNGLLSSTVCAIDILSSLGQW